MPGDLGSLLTFLGSAGGIGIVLSIIAESGTWFQNLSSGQKIGVLLGAALVCGFGSHYAIKYIPAGIIDQLNEPYQVLQMTVGIFLASKIYHAIADSTTPAALPSTTVTITASSGTSVNVPPANQTVMNQSAPTEEAKAASVG